MDSMPVQRLLGLSIAVVLLSALGAVAGHQTEIASHAPPPLSGSGVTGLSLPLPGTDPNRVPEAPVHVIASQSLTAPGRLSVLVTWDRSDPVAIGYQVLRDGKAVASTKVKDDPWDDFSFRDTDVAPGRRYEYTVVASSTGGASPASKPAAVAVRSDAQIGSGQVFKVDDSPGGTDRDKAMAAVTAARRAGGGVVLFGARTYSFDGAISVNGSDNVVLRGAGEDATFLEPAFAGGADPCGNVPTLVRFQGTKRAVPGVALAEPVEAGARTARVGSAAGLRPGQVIVFEEMQTQANPKAMADRGVVEDPGGGRDDRYRWDANEIVKVDGATVTFRYPFAHPFGPSVAWEEIAAGLGGGIENLTLQGKNASDTGLYRLLQLDHVARFAVAGVRARWANRSLVEVSGYDVNVVDLEAPDSGRAGADNAICKYKVDIHRAANVTVVGGEFGREGAPPDQSYLSVQQAQRVVVRASRFYATTTYDVNEHGGGSRGLIVENNYMAGGPDARFGAVLLGNDTWGFSGSAIVRNNTFVDNVRDLYLQENSYEVRFLHNLSKGNRKAVVAGYGWAGPFTEPDLRGSMRLTVMGNRLAGAQGDGVVLGGSTSKWFPYAGVRDVVVAGNSFLVAGSPLNLAGDESVTSRFIVFDNAGVWAKAVHPGFVDGDVWVGNGDGSAFGQRTLPAWSRPSFDWPL
ncbi:MAG TPA: hypothetical protein VGO92_08450 [Acidimicrobiales bacterium]|nr:hypothetical protein [Acidimicrobiales bacterium]